jgi:uncharacterized protein (DUF305 family)
MSRRPLIERALTEQVMAMTPTTARGMAAALLASLSLAACSGRPQQTVETAPQPALPSAQSEQAAIAQARADSVTRPYTEADIRFMTGMIAHHAQALVMAGWAPTHGASASLQTLCQRVINAQRDEIRTMQAWLRDRRQPVPEPNPTGMMMTMNGEQHPMLMPGMLTEAQMKQLDAARGPEFDRLFLTFMIQHHQGAVSMVHDLFESYGAAEDEAIFKLASDINIDQTTEIARMQQMLFMLSVSGPAS